jgi:hypothetical protein
MFPANGTEGLNDPLHIRTTGITVLGAVPRVRVSRRLRCLPRRKACSRSRARLHAARVSGTAETSPRLGSRAARQAAIRALAENLDVASLRHGVIRSDCRRRRRHSREGRLDPLVVIVVLGFVLLGIAARRNRGTQTPAAIREPDTKLHRQDLATNPLPDSGPQP